MIDLPSLSTHEAATRLRQYGQNVIPLKKPSLWLRLGHWLGSPITLMLLAAALLSLYLHRTFDFYFILSLTALNAVITFWQEHQADAAIDKLQSKLTIQVKVLRDNKWQRVPSALIVPGDVVEVGIGDLLPADLTVVESHNLTVNEAALTGESLPKEKNKDDPAFSGSYVTTGLGRGVVKATGIHTTYGKTLISVEKARKRSLLEKDILSISTLLSAISLTAVVILTFVLLHDGLPIGELLRLDLSLIIAGIPVSLPTVMAIIISLGIIQLAEKHVIVRQLSALENLANVSLLLTDKTGTLTENRILVDSLHTFDGFSESDVMRAAALVIPDPATNALDKAIAQKAQQLGVTRHGQVITMTPADSIRKHATVQAKIGKDTVLLSLGAPQVIESFCRLGEKQAADFEAHIKQAAEKGFRTLAIASKENTEHESNMRLMGLLFLTDTVRPEAHDVINYLKSEGIETRMVTGDSYAIANRVAQDLGLHGQVLPKSKLNHLHLPSLHKTWWHDKAGFAEILPEDKYHLVEAAKRHFVVAVTGDGINDLPAIATSDVGFAVSQAVDALKSSADIVILTDGITVIKDALVEGRKIFERLYSYSVYRISESFRLILTIAFLGFTVHTYPLSPIQLILIAFLNDLPIISLAYNHVKLNHKPSQSRSKARLLRGLLHGSVGITNSLGMYFLLTQMWHLPLPIVQTVFFLKLTVSGHMLIYVAHTDERWYKFLPSLPVILTTTITQLIASLLAGFGLFMAPISFGMIVFVWIWSFGWMQVSDQAKKLVPQK